MSSRQGSREPGLTMTTDEYIRHLEATLDRLARAVSARAGSTHRGGCMSLHWEGEAADEMLAAHAAACGEERTA